MNARRDALVLSILITAVMLLIWNGSTFFHEMRVATQLGPDIRLASTALTLNVALILFGWRRYVDLQHEAELRADGERRAVVLATTDHASGLFNRKGFADHAEVLSVAAQARGDDLVVLSVQMHRFKSVNEQHGFEMGDRLLKALAQSLNEALGPAAVIARVSADEFAIALAAPANGRPAIDLAAEAALRSITRPF